MTIYRRTGFTSNTVVFTKPGDFTDTVKASVSVKPKNIGQAALNNVAWQVKLNRRAPVTEPMSGDGCCLVLRHEDLSATLNVSGSAQGFAQVDLLIEDLLTVVEQWRADLVKGFLPLETAPSIPAIVAP